MKRIVHILFSILLLSSTAIVQGQNLTADSLQATLLSPALLDSLPKQTPQNKKQKAVITDKIPYKADRIRISVDGNIIYLEGNAEIEYQSLTLKAEKIRINKKENKLYAQGVPDSIDEKGNQKYRGNPVFTEKGQEPMRGNEIEYDFETKRGKIKVGRTNMEPGYYKGSEIYKIADSTLLVEDGYFTTCDLPDNPHFYFRSDKMRLQMKDKVVAKPIYFYIADIPVGVLPFGVFPNKGGRHSGITIPSYGESRVGGRFLRGLGYYWAPNDYFDATMQTDFYDKLGFTFRGDARYKVRYLLGGSVAGEYFPKDPSTGQRRERWRFSFSHNQTIDPTLSIRGSGSFQSDKDFRRDTSPNINDRLNQNVTSSLSINKSFKGTKNSLSISLSQNQNLQTDESDFTFPRVSFSRRQSGIWETFTGKSAGAKRSWYENIYFSYNSQALRKGSRRLNPAYTDTSSLSKFNEKESFGIKHSLSFNSPQKLLYFSINPSVSYDEVWVDELNFPVIDKETGKVTEEKEKQFGIRRTFNSSVSVRTKMYGLFEPNIGDLKFIRHIIDPSVSFSFAPDFSDPAYGYFTRIEDTSGVITKYDKFKGSTFGSTPTSESRRMNLSLSNLFQAKFIDEEGKEEKVDFFKANFSTSHNFLADSLKWGNVSSNFSTKILGQNISVRATHSLYALNKAGTRQIDTFVFERGNLPRLLSFNTSFGYTINNKTFASKEDAEKTKSRRDQRNNKDKTQANGAVDQDSLENEDLGLENTLTKERDLTKKIDLPWSASFRLNYSLSRTTPASERETIGLSANANFKLSKNWKIRWQASFDLVEKDLVYQTFNIYRDLHCWEMSFNWQPTRQYYSFQINIKSPSLQDIKLTKHPRNSTFSRY